VEAPRCNNYRSTTISQKLTNQSINIVRPEVDQTAGQLSLPHVTNS